MLPIPGYPGYYITSAGQVYQGSNLLKPGNLSSHKAPEMRLIQNGKPTYRGLAKLVATVFLPNPENHAHIIFKDKNNKNCRADNIAWASGKDHNTYIQSFKKDPGAGRTACEIDPERQPIPGYPDYYISPNGVVYCKERILFKKRCKGRAERVLLINPSGKPVMHTVAKLVAAAFIPNRENWKEVIFKDRDKTNCNVSNLQWVSASDFNRHKHNWRGGDELLGPIKPKKMVVPDWIDPERVPLEYYPGYYITPKGVVYRGDKIIRPIKKKNISLKVRVRRAGWPPKTYHWLGLGSLVAKHFLPNPKGDQYIIFKDRNSHHCSVENIAWVDGATFAWYAGLYRFHTGRRKIVLDRHEAAAKCTDACLKQYYLTLDEYWLQECWQEIESRITHYKWAHYRSECYMYFMDRAKRFSILKNPTGLMICYMKGLKAQARKEVSPELPAHLLMATDESLRTRRSSSWEYE